MVRSWLLTVVLALALAASGCITSTNMTEGDEPQDTPPQQVVRSDTTTWTESVSGPSVTPQEGVVAGPWTLEGPEGLQTLKAELTWTRAQNEFRLRITTPSGETFTRSSSGQNVTFAPTDAASGEYTFEVVATGLVVTDEIRLTVSYSWLEEVTGAPSAEQLAGQIQYTQDGSKWRATIVYATEQSGVEDLTLDIDTFNGAIDLARTGGPAKATLKAWARADTKERAADLVQAVAITLGIEGKTLTARAVDDTDRSGSESTGASIDIRVPGTVAGAVDTSNGAISLSGIETSGLSADTSNGGITGDVTSSGDLSFDTSNGGIDLRITPTKSLALAVDTSNGVISLDLGESGDIGYQLEAETSNGRISEDMEEASLSGTNDDTTRTLTTDGFSGRAIKVTGNVDTSNGNVQFDGA